MFVRIEDREYGDNILINTESIAIIWEESCILLMCGNHGAGNGLIKTNQKDMRKLLECIESVRKVVR